MNAIYSFHLFHVYLKTVSAELHTEIFFLFREVGSGINVIMSEMASNFFGIVAQSIQRKTFLREFSTNGKSLSHFHCDCRNCQMLLKFFVLYLLFVMNFIKVIFYYTVICLYMSCGIFLMHFVTSLPY